MTAGRVRGAHPPRIPGGAVDARGVRGRVRRLRCPPLAFFEVPRCFRRPSPGGLVRPGRGPRAGANGGVAGAPADRGGAPLGPMVARQEAGATCRQRIGMPERVRAITRRWISLVPSKME
ncbi:hypothetical protein TPA0909_23730 [Streptomyces albus]|nr:hypothetical protein TPA0909_23730 [Streptomyces albus]